MSVLLLLYVHLNWLTTQRSFCISHAVPPCFHMGHRPHIKLPYSEIKKSVTRTTPSCSPHNLKRNAQQNLQKVAFHCAWHVQCNVYGICLKCYVAVDVSECLSRCGNMETLSEDAER